MRIACLVIGSLCSFVNADVIINSAERSTTTAVYQPVRLKTESMNGVGPWFSANYQEVTDPSHEPGKPTWGRADQQSDIQPTHIVAVGRQGGYDGLPIGGAGEGSGVNRISAAFIVQQPTPYDLLLSYERAGGFWNQYTVRLTGAAGDVALFTDAGGDGDFSSSGVLAPGVYTFSALLVSGGAGSSTSGAESMYSIQLLVPAPASLGLLTVLGLGGRRR